MSDEQPSDLEILTAQVEELQKLNQELVNELSGMDSKLTQCRTFLTDLSHAVPVNGKVQAGWVVNAGILLSELDA